MRFGRAGALVTIAALLGCAGTDGGAPSTTVAVTASPSAPTAPAGTAGPEPAGVPGVDDTDAWCAAWARYGGSLQIVSVALAFGGLDDVQAARLELAAAPAVRAAVAEIADAWPDAVAGERQAVLAQVLGPFDGRASRAETALRNAGATAGDLEALADAWSAVLRTRDPEQPVVSLDAYPAALLALLDEAAVAFAANATRFDRDPSLRADSDAAPGTRALLARQCPDVASSGIGDAI